MIIATAAWGFHVAALALAPLSIVQAVLAAGLVLLAVMAETMFGFRVGPRQWWGVVLTASGLLLLVVTLPDLGGAHSTFPIAEMTAFESGLLVVGGLLIAGPRLGGPREHHGIMLGGAAGILFGVSDVAIKAITGLIGSEGALDGLLSPWLVVAVLASVVAFYASARGLQEGLPVPVIAITGTAANVVGFTGGYVVFGDPLPSSGMGIAAQLLAFAMVCIAVVLAPAPVRAAATRAPG